MGDIIRRIDGVPVTAASDINLVIARHTPGQTIQVEYVDRTNVPRVISVTLVEDARLELVPLESIGGTLTAEQRAFRADWLGAGRN